MNPQKSKKRRISQCRLSFNLGTDPSPLAQDDIRIEDELRHKVFVPCLNGDSSAHPMNGAVHSELAVVIEVTE